MTVLCLEDREHLPESPHPQHAASRAPGRIMMEHTQERERLSALAQCLTETLGREMPQPQEFVTKADLATDNQIQAEIARLRAGFLAGTGEFASRTWLTPATGEQVKFPGTDKTYRFCYDRQHTPEILERRIRSSGPDLGRRGHAILCGSGMAAINTLLQSLAHVTDAGRRRMGAFASYFETHSLFRMSAFADSWSRVTQPDELLVAVRGSVLPVLYIEPVQYNWSLDTVPWAELLSAFSLADEPPITILDTTLSGQSTAVEQLLAQLAATPCPLLVRVRSGLKLDQEGLELASVGVLEWWPRADLASRYDRLAHLADAFRTISGSGLCRAAACALSPPFVLDRGWGRSFAEGVFASNRALFELLQLSGALFSSKVYPCRPWDSPFVLLTLTRDCSTEYIRLAALIQREAKRRGLSWIMSGSFGFRTERFETILPGEQLRVGETSAGVLKVAAGRYRGARFWGIVDLLNELASFDTLKEAEAAWRPQGSSVQ